MRTSVSHVLFSPPVGGARPDIDPLFIPENCVYDMLNFVRDGSVIRTRDGLALKAQVGSGQSRVSGIFRLANEDIGPVLIVTTDQAIYKYDELSDTFQSLMPSGTVLNGNDVFPPQARLFFKQNGSHIIVVNGVDVPQVLEPGAQTVRALLGNPPEAAAIAISANRVILAKGSFIYVSSFNDCDAGYQTELIVNLAETPGRILAMLEQGNMVTVVFKEDAIYEIHATGGAVPFNIMLKIANINGPASGNAIVQLPDGNFLYMSSDGSIYRYDGVHVELASLPSRIVSRKGDKANMRRCFGLWSIELNGALFFVPDSSLSYCVNGMLISYPDLLCFPIKFEIPVTCGTSALIPESPIWEDFDIPWGPAVTWELLSGDYVRTLFGSNLGKVYMFSGTEDDGQPIEINIITKAVPMAQNVPFVTIHGAEVFFSGGPATITASLLTTDYGETESLAQVGPIPQIGEGPLHVGFRATCRTGMVKISGYASGMLRYRGSALAISQRGQR